MLFNPTEYLNIVIESVVGDWTTEVNRIQSWYSFINDWAWNSFTVSQKENDILLFQNKYRVEIIENNGLEIDFHYILQLLTY